MPLIIITGYPSSGKTTRASQLKEYFEERMKKTVHTVNEETVMKTMGEDRNSLFTDSAKEKALRGAVKSEVQRFIDKESVIIIDAGNYIKGYRYELYCISKGAGTTQCTIHCGVDEDTVHRWNSERECGYKEDVLRALIMRYEAPDSRNRWDYPLFTALFTDDLKYDEIYSSLFERKPPPPNQSTQCAPLSSTNFLYELDKVTQEILSRFIDKESVIIIDAGNYIKGYRYELYCISKGAGTTQCTIHCGVDEDTVHRWNSERECGYKEDVLRALIMRYEAPDSRNRWDYPLFTALFTDDLKYDEIYSSLFERKPPPPNQSTQCAPLSSTNFLYELDKVTQEILSAILSAQKLGVDSDIKIPGFKDSVRTNGVKLSVPQLSRLRRQFLSYTKLHPSNDISKIGPLFIQFLNSNIT